MTDDTRAEDKTMELRPEQPRRDWVTPEFERIPLSEAMGVGTTNLTVTDGASLYS